MNHRPAFGRRRPVVIAAIVAAAAAMLPFTPHATAQAGNGGKAAASPAAAPADKSFSLPGVAPGPHTVTLVTGDSVKLTPVGNRYSADPQPAASSDGRSPSFFTQAGPNGIYVIPDDALPAVTAGRLDRELFNVTYLAENGYATDKASNLPVIVQYSSSRSAASVKAAAEALPASTPTHDLTSIHGAALDVAKKQAGSFWKTVRGAAPPSGRALNAPLGSGISKVWLDRKVHASLDASVPLIGAPQAWAAGHDGSGVKVAVLDTGIDASHPDFDGKIAESQSFVPGVDSAADGFGHGTHVASIITGSGAASGGKYKGVAPGVKLAIGKVLDDTGSGETSWILDGMEWAAHDGAKIVSMSLGGDPTDGSDPLSQAVDELTATTGTLFVIAAGNAGPVTGTIASPGAADAALTVAATSKADTLAGFSSRGPRVDGALKPDIAAPGVNITAARAAGTSLGPVVDEQYTTLSGTSMATPHVAGAAAILAQDHPDWQAAQLKAALMSTSKDDGFTVYQQGAGRVDVARADRQQVFATTPNVDFGSVEPGQGPLTRQITYTNLGTSPVTLALSRSMRPVNSSAQVPDGTFTGEDTVTVPAGGTATTTVTLDASRTGLGDFTGTVVATDDAAGVRVTTPVGLSIDPPKFTLTVHTIGRDGQPASPFAQDTLDVSTGTGFLDGAQLTDTGTVEIRVPAGTYHIAQLLKWADEDSRDNVAWLFNPQVSVTGDTDITLDARKAGQLTYTTPKPAGPLTEFRSFGAQRNAAGGQHYKEAFSIADSAARLWATPTEPVTAGTFRFWDKETLGPPEVTMAVRGTDNLPLHPFYAFHLFDSEAGFPGFVHFTGTRDLAVVDVGLGRPEDIAGLDLHGKLVLMATDDNVCGTRIERIGPIRDAGAAGIIAFPGAGTGCTIPLQTVQDQFTGPLKPLDIPKVSVSRREGLALRAQLSQQPVTLRVTGQPELPYTYEMSPYEEGRVPNDLHYTFTDKQLAQVDLSYPDKAVPRGDTVLFSAKWDDENLIGSAALFRPHAAPHRTEYIGPLDPDVVYSHEALTSVPLDQTALIAQGPWEIFDRPTHTQEHLLVQPRTPGPGFVSPDVADLLGRHWDGHHDPIPQVITDCSLCRRGDFLSAGFFQSSVSNGLPQVSLAPASVVHLSKDGVDIPLDKSAIIPGFTLPADPGTYQLTAQLPASVNGPRTNVTWTFTSERPTTDAVRSGYLCVNKVFDVDSAPCQAVSALFATYDLGDTLDDSDNTVAAGREHRFRINVTNPQTPNPPKIATVKLWTSTDDGKNWVPATVTPNPDGSYTATTHYPDFANTTGAVSLKVDASDTNGNRIEQTSIRAFALSDNNPTQ